MATNFKFLSFILIIGLVFSSCKKDPETVSGCTDPLGDNYNAEATIDNSSCTFQKRFLGDYTGLFNCAGTFKAVFSMADLSITELIKKDEVNIIIQSAIGPLPVKGILTKNEVTVDATLTNLKVKAGDVVAGGGDTEILCDGTVKTVLTISADNKTLTGSLNIKLVTKEAVVIGVFPLPVGFTLSDDCAFTGTKK
ncbi:MAG: hypothetical protein KA270_13025 [Saprospiraceae bacterium]|jgi:hypothetical protein|nr:hypothetical protein [Saprospiraceae bacterium]MBP6235694.1 hypothetical protein [Saprospiraceae bacterium]MBP6568086.1 hypothetical protein [Saprospiraceae bacterium]